MTDETTDWYALASDQLRAYTDRLFVTPVLVARPADRAALRTELYNVLMHPDFPTRDCPMLTRLYGTLLTPEDR